MKKNIFLLLFLALYSITVLSQSLPTKIFKVDYFGNKTLLLEGETNFIETEQLVAFLISVRESHQLIDTLSDLILISDDSTTNFSLVFFETASVGILDLEEGNHENDFSLLLEIPVTREIENNFTKNTPIEVLSLKDQEALKNETREINLLLLEIASKRACLNLMFRKK